MSVLAANAGVSAEPSIWRDIRIGVARGRHSPANADRGYFFVHRHAWRGDWSRDAESDARPDLQRAATGGVMDASTNPFDEYGERIAASDLRRYRKNGPRPWTRTLIEALKAEGVEGATLLDIGGGIGAIQHELLDAGAAQAMSVDASAAYLEAAREEGERRGFGGRVAYRHGDFVELAESVPSADIVTLDRVVNVYPHVDQLVGLSAERAQRLYGLVLPRDTRVVRLGIRAINLVQRLRRQRVRAAVVPLGDIERVVRDKGLIPRFSQDAGRVWQVVVYGRP
jgi:magnesium-protoporphyrin O-methyltransferase